MRLHPVLSDSLLQPCDEIAIRLAIGATRVSTARSITAYPFSMIQMGAATGLALSFAIVRFIKALQFEAKAPDLSMLLISPLALIFVALIA